MLNLFVGFSLGTIFGIFLPVYLRRRCWRSMFYPQSWYWFVSRKAFDRGYTNWVSFKFLSSLGIRVQ